MIPANATIIRKAYDDFANGNIPAVLEAFDTSITWHVPGHSPLSGDYKGHDEVVVFLKHTLALCGGIFAIEVHHVLAEEDVVVVLVTVKTERNGRSAAFPEVIYGGLRMKSDGVPRIPRGRADRGSLLVQGMLLGRQPPSRERFPAPPFYKRPEPPESSPWVFQAVRHQPEL